MCTRFNQICFNISTKNSSDAYRRIISTVSTSFIHLIIYVEVDKKYSLFNK